MSFTVVRQKPLRDFQIILLLGLLAFPAFFAFPAAAASSDDALREAVRRLLKEHPELILDTLKENSETVLEIAQQGSILRKRKATLAQWEKDAKERKTIDVRDRAFRGNIKAPVTIVAYSDFTCPYCRQAEVTITQLLKKYDGTIRVTFKALPKDDYPLSQATAKYATAAFMMDPQKGWKFFDVLFNSVSQFEREGENFLKTTAAEIGLDFKKLKADAGSVKVQERLDADRAEADALGISGTPYFLVNDLVARGAISKDLFEEAIEMALRLTKK